VKLPFLEPEHKHASRAVSEPVEAPWQTLMLVCTKCKGARHGPDARDVRKGMKHRVGKSKGLRVLESDCLSVCPEHAITVCIVRARGVSELRLVREHAQLDDLADLLSR
jgi:ferredoxin